MRYNSVKGVTSFIEALLKNKLSWVSSIKVKLLISRIKPEKFKTIKKEGIK